MSRRRLDANGRPTHRTATAAEEAGAPYPPWCGGRLHRIVRLPAGTNPLPVESQLLPHSLSITPAPSVATSLFRHDPAVLPPSSPSFSTSPSCRPSRTPRRSATLTAARPAPHFAQRAHPAQLPPEPNAPSLSDAHRGASSAAPCSTCPPRPVATGAERPVAQRRSPRRVQRRTLPSVPTPPSCHRSRTPRRSATLTAARPAPHIAQRAHPAQWQPEPNAPSLSDVHGGASSAAPADGSTSPTPQDRRRMPLDHAGRINWARVAPRISTRPRSGR
jgi:hypothetical protein